MGGGGDVVGSLAIARFCESLGTPFALGGIAWERIVVDPRPGPRPLTEIAGGRRLGEHAVLADGETSTADGIAFSEALMARHLGEATVLIDVTGGPAGVAAGLEASASELDCDLVVLADVGGDVLATGSEPGLASPLCDAVVLAGALELAAAGGPRPLLAVIGAGCDGELSPAEVLERLAAAARAGAWLGAWGLTPGMVDELEVAASASYTEASMQVVRCARGEIGEVPIRGGRRTVHLGPVGAITFFLDPLVGVEDAAPLASAVAGTAGIEAARERLEALGIRTELDYERERAAESAP
jgi:hypothetical protein